jgi:hypothetical protein
MTVAELLGRISSVELAEWMVVYADEDAAWEAAHPEQPAPDGRPRMGVRA